MKNKYIYLLFLITGVILIFLANLYVSLQKNDTAFTKPTTTVVSEAISSSVISETRGYTSNEVAAHSSRQDCYIIVKSKVYDITTYFGKHPAGDKIMLQYCGQETSGAFAVTHSNFAWNLLSDYYIGDLSK